jgi:fructose-1,6-bisphosphatase-3
MENIHKTSTKYLELLSEKFPTLQKAAIEIINLQAILELPKGTEHFISDIHGEYEAFNHLLNNCSGVIREKVEIVFANNLDKVSEFLTLIYYTETKLAMTKKNEENINEWYIDTLHNLIEVCRITATKYTRSKVRKAMPKNYGYIIDELLNTPYDNKNKLEYYDKILSTVILLGQADTLIIEFSKLIKKLAVDKLHIVGDIYDRGMDSDLVIDALIGHHSVDIQWGNHDLVWMGAASGSKACILNVLYNSLRYGNMHVLEIGYGISMREISDFAANTYSYSEAFQAKTDGKNRELYSKILKSVSIMLFKVEGEIIQNHPEFEMQDRILLLKTDFNKGEVKIDSKKYKLKDNNFPTIDINNALLLTEEESRVLEGLKQAFLHCERLQRHIDFLYKKGSLYKCYNGNLLFHGCIPMTEYGCFDSLIINNKSYIGKELYKKAEDIIIKAHYIDETEKKDQYLDYMWYFWCGKKSPLYGRQKMTTFERLLIVDKELEKEPENPYYYFSEQEEYCNYILKEFGITDKFSHIINGHIPVKAKLGESPVRANGKRLVIDGGLSKSYHKATGNAGYTLIFNSYGLKVKAHKPFESKKSALLFNKDIESKQIVFEKSQQRIKVRGTDTGKTLEEQISDLMQLVDAYKSGIIKEKEINN